MSCLHILNKAPGEPRFDACLSGLTHGDTLLLIENAVIAVVHNTTDWPEGVKLNVLLDDLEARGLKDAAVGKAWLSVDYPGFVTLTTESEKVVCW
ncbi:sulfurtransferase complex subunit TusB [Marinobacter nanhaiticus D15-8W]|uniref:Sulfurtransferase complex subunit TusB n=1 Tax=Marinobacter nanhaiticus D15-8W TaxID=626887 RepID=N6WZJ1_9GAMM|nr:sulfurtransferase complex subunit TusB [Marinobacter nanhaiticus]ENO14178.1 sulfurtransferase complex subunit TusB [Marinobacter nanhaiticus D15-8W]BES71563.1 sulfurtransferase complex subunit TusB [Marinobacter nanhaiticus D15-8W]